MSTYLLFSLMLMIGFMIKLSGFIKMAKTIESDLITEVID